MLYFARLEGFRLDSARNINEAHRKIKEITPDLIVLDLALPIKGGFEILRELQTVGKGNIPVIVITARMLGQKSIDLIRSEPNVREFLPKPFHQEAFIAALHAHTKGKPE